jgi:hypothetical protein
MRDFVVSTTLFRNKYSHDTHSLLLGLRADRISVKPATSHAFMALAPCYAIPHSVAERS